LTSSETGDRFEIYQLTKDAKFKDKTKEKECQNRGKMAELVMNDFIREAEGDPVIVPRRSSRIKTGVVADLETQNGQAPTCPEEIKWIKVEFDDGGEGIFYHTSVLIDLEWVDKIKFYETE